MFTLFMMEKAVIFVRYHRFGASEQAEYYELILNQLSKMAPIMLVDAEGKFVFASDAFLEDMGGISPEELGRKTNAQLVSENYYARSPSAKALREKRGTSDYCTDLKGNLVFTETSIIRDDAGNLKYVLCHSIKPYKIQAELEKLKGEVNQYKSELLSLQTEIDDRKPQIVYESASMRHLIHSVGKVSAVDISVMLTGESGVGKDLVAKEIHRRSLRSDKPFVSICIPIMAPSILEAELFGYVEGAFTNATRHGKVGLFEAANGGTVYLDEIGDIPLETQVKLLHVLENREITRLGSTTPQKLDIRIVSATNKDIKGMVAKGLFREDLFYRLCMTDLKIEPLRNRPEDILPLADFFLKRVNRRYHLSKMLTKSAMDALMAYKWPGNVRQLEYYRPVVILSSSDE